jgi:hypothetical protein
MVADRNLEGPAMAKVVLPRVQAMVLCDDIEATNEGGVFDLRGVRAEIGADTFPHTRPQLCVFAQISGHPGVAKCRLVLHDPETDSDQELVPDEEIELAGPLSPVAVPFWIADCEFPRPGVYWMQLYFGRKLLMERPLTLYTSEAPTNGQPHP